MKRVDQVALDKFWTRIQKEADKEFGTDDDSDSRVIVQVLDRTRFEGMHYMPVPYDHFQDYYEDSGEDTPDADIERIRRHREGVVFNASIAMNQLDIELRSERFAYSPRPEVRDNVLNEVEEVLGPHSLFFKHSQLPEKFQKQIAYHLKRLRNRK